jgi:hypothetical protein
MSRRTNNLLRLLASLLAVMLLSACVSKEDEETFEETAENHLIKYINLSITVSTGNYATHRAPAGGENGDGREAGFERENVDNGITLILYKGSGLYDALAKVDYIAYFVTTLSQTPQTALAGKTVEAVYTTGNQRLEDEAINTGDIYHAIVIANRNMTSQFPKGTPISDVRDYPFGFSLYSGDAKKPNECNNFVMTSENDVTINFGIITPTTVGTSGLLYTVNTPILIERMAARIDFCTQNGNYDANYGGYKYNVTGSGDMFVLTSVTPFNLYNENEYLLKRVQDAWTGTITTKYLGDETISNYVADPNTGNKNNTNTFSYLSPLDSPMSTDYQQTMTSSTFTDSDGKQSIVVGYAKENTLMPTSHLKKYATGLAITGHYYKKESGGTYTDKGERTYYGYLRHQGESTGSYKAQQWADLVDTDDASAKPMNFGIVRNNIYRVSIEGMTEDAKLILHIKVKKWDIFEHAPIYM